VTLSPRTRVSCDRRGPYCVDHADFDGGRQAARARARGAGWIHTNMPRLDICPACLLAMSR
jgi:hypothetical protein